MVYFEIEIDGKMIQQKKKKKKKKKNTWWRHKWYEAHDN